MQYVGQGIFRSVIIFGTIHDEQEVVGLSISTYYIRIIYVVVFCLFFYFCV